MADFDATGLANTVFGIAGAGIAIGMLAGLGRSMSRASDSMMNDNYRRRTYNRRPSQRQVERKMQYRSLVYEPRRSRQMTLKIPRGMPYLSIPQSRLKSMHRPLWR